MGVWINIYLPREVKSWKKWAIVLKPAGNNALFAYILAPICYSVFALTAVLFGGYDFYSGLGDSFAIGFWRAMLFAFSMTWLVEKKKKTGIRLKL